MVSHSSHKLHFLSSIFFLFTLDNFHCPIFKFIDCFIYCLNLPLNRYSGFFILITERFYYRISFWYTFILRLYWYFHFVHTSFSWLSLHLPVVIWAPQDSHFKVFGNVSSINCISGIDSVELHFPLNGPYIPDSLYASCDFFCLFV